jgi:F1F0 ATPase subunit 2
MNWAAAASTGFGLGIAYFGGLWIVVRALKGGRSPRGFAFARFARLALAAATFYALLKAGGFVAVAAGLIGVLAARWYLVRVIGGTTDGR